MKKILMHPITVISAVAASLLMVFAFKTTDDSHDHMLIVTRGSDLAFVFESTTKGYDKIKKDFRRESQGDWDFSPILREVQRYENEGWKLQSVQSNGAEYLYWLKK